MISNDVYKLVGVQRGEPLPECTSIGSYTIAYYDQDGEVYCGECATKLEHDETFNINMCGTYDEGEPMECCECACLIESSYGPAHCASCPEAKDIGSACLECGKSYSHAAGAKEMVETIVRPGRETEVVFPKFDFDKYNGINKQRRL